jgi:hypothetical protein
MKVNYLLSEWREVNGSQLNQEAADSLFGFRRVTGAAMDRCQNVAMGSTEEW